MLWVGVSLPVKAEEERTAGEQPSEDNSETYRQLDLFGDVFERVKAQYVEEKTDKELVESALNGMLMALDPHSSYMNEEQFGDMQVSTKGEFGGLGIEVTMENGIVKVVSPIDDTPAFKAGILAGDYIIQIDDEPVMGMALSDAVDKMRGKVGSEILLLINREGAEGPQEGVDRIKSHAEERVRNAPGEGLDVGHEVGELAALDTDLWRLGTEDRPSHQRGLRMPAREFEKARHLVGRMLAVGIDGEHMGKTQGGGGLNTMQQGGPLAAIFRQAQHPQAGVFDDKRLEQGRAAVTTAVDHHPDLRPAREQFRHRARKDAAGVVSGNKKERLHGGTRGSRPVTGSKRGALDVVSEGRGT